MMAQRRKTVLWLLVALGAAVIAVFAVLVVPNYRLYIVHTGSMTPTIPIGSAVLIEKGPVHVGQVITFHRLADGALVTHRFIAVKADGTLMTKGDGNTSPDLGSIPRSNVVGHVVAAPQHVGAWIHFLFYTPLGWVFDALILLMLALLLSGNGPRRTQPGGEIAE